MGLRKESKTCSNKALRIVTEYTNESVNKSKTKKSFQFYLKN